MESKLVITVNYLRFLDCTRFASKYIIDKSLGTVGRFCYKDSHVDRTEYEEKRKVSQCPQPTTSESLAVNMTQQIEMSYRKVHRNSKMKLMKAYLYTNQLKQTSRDDK